MKHSKNNKAKVIFQVLYSFFRLSLSDVTYEFSIQDILDEDSEIFEDCETETKDQEQNDQEESPAC